jgi:hypothetical protein
MSFCDLSAAVAESCRELRRKLLLLTIYAANSRHCSSSLFGKGSEVLSLLNYVVNGRRRTSSDVRWKLTGDTEVLGYPSQLFDKMIWEFWDLL